MMKISVTETKAISFQFKSGLSHTQRAGRLREGRHFR
jgi:hypothetical protein